MSLLAPCPGTASALGAEPNQPIRCPFPVEWKKLSSDNLTTRGFSLRTSAPAFFELV